jgi:hypothetical protein
MKAIRPLNCITAVCLVSFILLAGFSQAQMIVGTNLDGVSPWGANHFVDVCKNQSAWLTRGVDGVGWDTEKRDLMPVDANGWPTQIPFDPGDGSQLQYVHTQMPIRGAGVYRLIVEGTGRIEFLAADGLLDPSTPWQGSATFTPAGGQQVFELTIHDSEHGDGTGELFLSIHESDASDPLRNMKLIAPGHEATHEANPFSPSYVAGLDVFSNIRFMDWGQTNASPIVSWSERSTPNYYTQTSAPGVALEHQILMANQVQQSAWFCVPARANDDFVRNMARMVRDDLDPDLKVLVEYSNETWNFIFSQTGYVQDRGEALGLHPDRWIAGQRFVSLRSAQIWQIFAEEFGDQADNRLVKVMGGFAGNAFLTRQRMEYLEDAAINPNGHRADAVAIAPYFGSEVPEDIVNEDVIESISVDEILDRAAADLQGFATTTVNDHKQIADDFGAWMITYEGGQHLVAPFSHWNDETMTAKLIAANRHPRMYDLYIDYMDMMRNGGVTLHSNFSYVATPTQFGSWGLYEYQDQPITEAHKARATRDWIAANPAGNIQPVARSGNSYQVIDLDDDMVETVTLDGSASRDFDGMIVEYRWLLDGEVIGSGPEAEVQLPVGRHAVSLEVTDSGGAAQSSDLVVTVAPSSALWVCVESDFTGVFPSNDTPWTSTSELDPNVIFSGWELAGTLEPADYDNVFGFSGVFGADPLTYDQAIATDAYLSFTVEPVGEFELDLRGAEVAFEIERIGGLAPGQFYLLSSVDGFDVGLELAEGRVDGENAPGEIRATLPFEGFRTTEAIEFRIYTVGGQWGGHGLSLNSFRLNGAADGESEVLIGDVNLDGVVNLLDIRPFIDLLLSGGYSVEADINGDGAVNSLDIDPFIDILLGS